MSDHEMRDLSNQSFVFNELHHETVNCVTFTANGEEVVAGGQSGKVKVFNLKGRKERLCLSGHKEAVNTISISQDLLCTGSDDAQIIIWNAENGAFLASNNMHSLRVLQVIFVDSSRLVSMSADKLIMWDCPVNSAKGSLDVVHFRRTRSADFVTVKVSYTLEFLAAATTDNIITLWKMATAEVVLSLPGHTE